MPYEKATVENFIGKGITLPLVLTNGRPALSTGFDLIRASIITALSWEYGTRFFLNEFGSKITDLLEEPNDDILKTMVSTYIEETLLQWEPRIDLLGADVARNKDNTLDVTVVYRIKNTQQEDTFVFPFYNKLIY